MSTAMDKAALRQELRQARRALSEQDWQQRSQSIVARLLQHPSVLRAHGVALFHPLVNQREVDLRTLATALRAQGKRLYYADVGAGQLAAHGALVPHKNPEPSAPCFRLVGAESELVPAPFARGRFELLQPNATCPTAQRGDIDVVLVPCLGFDARGHRLGFGAGHYDRLLPSVRPPAQALLVAFAFQRVDALPNEAHDVACDGFVTETESAAV